VHVLLAASRLNRARKRIDADAEACSWLAWRESIHLQG